MLTYLRLLLADHRTNPERGASAIEYGLLVAGIAAALVFATFALGHVLEAAFETTCANVSDGVNGGGC